MARALPTPDLSAGDPYRVAARKVVAVRASELFERAANVLDTRDIEAVHDMRVASRRLRAALEAFAPCFPRKPYLSVLRDVKALADALGERRDPDVALARLERFAASVPAPDRPGIELLTAHQREQQQAGNAAVAAALEAIQREHLRERVAALIEAGLQ